MVGKSNLADHIVKSNNYTSCNLDIIKDGIPHLEFYNNQDVLIIDDYDGKIDYQNFLKLLDRREYIANVKFGSVNFNSKLIIITNNLRLKNGIQIPTL